MMARCVREAARGRQLTTSCRGRSPLGGKALPGKKDLSQPLAATYQPGEVERDWYGWWEAQGFFRRTGAEERFVMPFPPPNVTGSLHLGHALTTAVQDALARWQQMRGCEVVFVPGADHAGIATQVVVERHLWDTTRTTKHHLGRDRFVEEVWKWKEAKGTMIYDQLKRLGASLDWDRAVFTMDQHMSQAVTEAFIRLYNAGLVYRREALVNWCCSLQSAISDIEVDHVHLTGPTQLTVPGYDRPVTFGKMYDFAYKVVDSEEEVVVSTTRPETMLGDTAVMVHPEDARYTHLQGLLLTHPLRRDTIPVIVDAVVDPQFGTGAVKVTPGHSHEDYEVGHRHHLALLSILDDHGRLTDLVPEFKGLSRFEAREAVIEALTTRGLYRGCRPHPMMVPRCSRTQDVIEPILKPQWFIRSKELARGAIEAVQSGELQILPERHKQVWFDWLENITDWCVSRQLWWGHRIPVYRATTDTQEFWVAARSMEDAKGRLMEKEGVPESSVRTVEQEEDVLDTWFSSGLFPFAMMGWPGDTEDLRRYYPAALLETGHDILFFWVARMVMLGLSLTGKLPFKTVLLHGLLCDAQGHKMSKSRGNIIDPTDVINGASLEVLCGRVRGSQDEESATKGLRANFPNGIPECGADALRFTLCSHSLKSQLLSVDVTRIEQSKFFGNKVWQTVKFLLGALERSGKVERCACPVLPAQRGELALMDKWILSHLARLVCSANDNFAAYDLHLVTAAFLSFWHSHLCDVYLESIKPVLQSKSEEDKCHALQTLWTCVDTGLRVLSPFMPFLTEELYQRLPRRAPGPDSVMQSDYPQAKEWESMKDVELEGQVDKVLRVASAFRALKTSYNIPHNKITGSVVSSDEELRDLVRENLVTVSTLGRVGEVRVREQGEPVPAASAVCTLSHATTIYLHLQGVIDPKIELSRLRKKLLKLRKEESKVAKIMSSPGYYEKSPPHIQENHAARLASLKNEMENLKILIQSLEDMEQW